MESNRNLSSIISRIRDEGPPGKGDDAPVATPVTTRTPADESATVAPTGRRSPSRLLPVLLLLLVAGAVLFAGSYSGGRDGGGIAGIIGDLQGWFGAGTGTSGAGVPAPVVSDAGAPVDDRQLRELQQHQREITARLDELAAAIAELRGSVNGNRVDTDAAIAGLRREQQAASDALEARLVALQKQPAVSAVKQTAQAKQTATVTTADKGGTSRSPAPAVAKPVSPDKGAEAGTGEEWVVNVASSSREEAMVELAEKLREQGIKVERQTLTIDGDLMYRLRVPGFTNSVEARRYAEQLGKEHALRGAWISRK